MTKSEIFTRAHKIAKTTVSIVGDYMIAFSLALKEVYKMATKTIEGKLVELGGKKWTKCGNRVYCENSTVAQFFGDDSDVIYFKRCNVYFDVDEQQFKSNDNKTEAFLNKMLNK